MRGKLIYYLKFIQPDYNIYSTIILLEIPSLSTFFFFLENG